LIEKGEEKLLIWLKCQIPEVEAESSIEKNRCLWVIESGRLAYGGKQGLIFEIPEAWIMK